MDALASLTSLEHVTLATFCRERHGVSLEEEESQKIFARWKKLWMRNGTWLCDNCGMPPSDIARTWLKIRLMELNKFPFLGQPSEIRLTVTMHCWSFAPVLGAKPIDYSDVVPINLGTARSKISHTTLVIQPIDTVAWSVTNWQAWHR